MNACTVAVFASILLTASASLAQDRPAAPPAGAPQPLPAGVSQPPPAGAPQPMPAGAPQPMPAGAPQPLPAGGYGLPPGVAPPPGYALPPGYAPPGYYPPPNQAPWPRTIKWNEGEEIPMGYHKGGQIRKGMVIAGSVLFGSAWVPTAITLSLIGTSSSDGGGITAGVIPVIGPWITAGTCASNSNFEGGCSGSGNGILLFWLVFDGVQQGLGLGLLIGGIVAKEPVLLRNDVKEAKPLILPVPMTFGPRSAGLGFAGTM